MTPDNKRYGIGPMPLFTRMRGAVIVAVSVVIALTWQSWIVALIVSPIVAWGAYLMLRRQPLVVSFYNELTNDRLILHRIPSLPDTVIPYSRIDHVELGRWGKWRRAFEKSAVSFNRLFGGHDMSHFVDNWVLLHMNGWIWLWIFFIPFPTRKLRVLTERREEFAADLQQRIAGVRQSNAPD